MNINNNYNISFGQLVSTPLLLKAGSGKIKFEDAKKLNNELGIIHSGYIGFYKRAVNIAKKAANKDEKLAQIFEELKNTSKEQMDSQIKKYTDILGEKIDITI